MKDSASYHILPLVPHNSETTKKYCIAGKFDGKLNLAIWWSGETTKLKSANIIFTHIYYARRCNACSSAPGPA